MATLFPVLYLKYQADKEREKIVSIVISDDNIEIFCKAIRNIKDLGVDLKIKQDSREVFSSSVEEVDTSS
ncbi:hypothetical protein BDZ91DRAFT_804604 [Kalaharituber pfeilii]|nr:hypothetical protein BDZ91DRAFT_804604 [Kalaharituber pfeilii]